MGEYLRKSTACGLILQKWHPKSKCRLFLEVMFLFSSFRASLGKFGQKWCLKVLSFEKVRPT